MAVFSGIFFLVGATCSVAEAGVERAPVVKSVKPKRSSYNRWSKSKRRVVAPISPAPAITIPVPQNNDKISGDVTQSWQPYSYP